MEKTWKEKYYYIRDEVSTSKEGLGRPIITVCLIRVGNDIGRGIAICSDLDQPCKKVGRVIAKTRALYALTEEKNGCKIGRWSLDNVLLANREFMSNSVPFPLKSTYNPELTDYEKKLFKTKIEELEEVEKYE